MSRDARRAGTPSGKVTAVINDHAANHPDWRDHVASVTLLPSPEWEHWTSKDGVYMSQDDFAEHLQDGVDQIRRPDAATMLEIAQSIQGVTKADWKKATRLDNGEVSFAYHEQIEATAGRTGQIEIPATFDLAISPFYGEPPSDIVARLRYRVRSDQLSIGYRLLQPHDVIAGVMQAIAERLTQAGFGNVYLGSDHVPFGFPPRDELPLGALVATCVLDRASKITAETAAELEQRNPAEFTFGHYAPGRWAWVFRDVQRLAIPVPFRGSQGAFDVPDELLAAREADHVA